MYTRTSCEACGQLSGGSLLNGEPMETVRLFIKLAADTEMKEVHDMV
jgi:hypothetical protein